MHFRITTAALAVLASSSAGQLPESAHLVPDDAKEQSFFGSALDVDGRWALVGARGEDVTGGENSGAAYLFRHGGGVWTQVQKLKALVPDELDEFGASVAICGTTAVVGAPRAHAPGIQNYGFAYVFELEGGVLVETAKLELDEPGPHQRIGVTTALSGDTVLFGDEQVGFDGLASSGAVYAFERRDGVWLGPERIFPPTPWQLGLFGSAVDLHGDTAVIGERGSDVADDTAGAVHVYEKRGDAWVPVDLLTASDASVGDDFGAAVSLDRDRLLVGDTRKDSGGVSQHGAAYVFVKRDGRWHEEAVLVAPVAIEDEHFGASVHLDGDRAVVGTDGKYGFGHAYVFERTGSTWSEGVQLVASTPGASDLGHAVHLVPGGALVTAPRLDQATGAVLEYAGSAATSSTSSLVRALPVPWSVPCTTDEEWKETRQRAEANLAALEARAALPAPFAQMPASFGWPLRPAPGLDDLGYHVISGFPDLDPAASVLDYECGPRTYDGHNGTDFVLWPFHWYKMDFDQVEIVAAAGGIIIDKDDGHDDRSCTPGGSSNKVAIRHFDGTMGWYLHMKKWSVTSKGVGDTVVQGEYLGIVGSSGSSALPHLHFDLRDENWVNFDPHLGLCNHPMGGSRWSGQRPYFDSEINAIRTHGAPPVFPPCPQQEIPNFQDEFGGSDTVYFGIYHRDLLGEHEVIYAVRRPDGTTADAGSYSGAEPHYTAAYALPSYTLPSDPQTGSWVFAVDYAGRHYERAFLVR